MANNTIRLEMCPLKLSIFLVVLCIKAGAEMDTESILCFDASLHKRIRLDQLCDGVNDCVSNNNNSNNKSEDELHCSSDGAFTGVFIPHHSSGSLILNGSSCLCLSPTSIECPGGQACQICEVDEVKVTAGKECLIRDGRKWDDLNLTPEDYAILDMILIKDRGRWEGKDGDMRLVSYHLPSGYKECISGFYSCGEGGDCAKSDDYCENHLAAECERSEVNKYCRQPGKEGCFNKSGFCKGCWDLQNSYLCRDYCHYLFQPCDGHCPNGRWNCRDYCLLNHEQCDVDEETSVWRDFPKGTFYKVLPRGKIVEFEIVFLENVTLRNYGNLELRIDTATVLEIFPIYKFEEKSLTLTLQQIRGLYRRTTISNKGLIKITVTVTDASIGIWLPDFQSRISFPITKDAVKLKLKRNPKSFKLPKVIMENYQQEFGVSPFPFSLSEKRERSGRWDLLCQDGKHYCTHLDTCLEPLTPCQNSSYSIWRLNGLYQKGEETPDVKVILTGLNFEPDFLTITAKGGQGQVRIYDRDTGHYGRISMVPKYSEEAILIWTENKTDSITRVNNATNDTILGFAFVRGANGTAVYLAHGENVVKMDEFPRIRTWRKVVLSSFHNVLAVNAEGSSNKNSGLMAYKFESQGSAVNKKALGFLILTALGLLVLLIVILVGFNYRDRKSYFEANRRAMEAASNSNTCARESLLRTSNFCMNDASAAVFEEIEMKEFKVYNEYYESSSNVLPSIPEVGEEEGDECCVFEIRQNNSFYNVEDYYNEEAGEISNMTDSEKIKILNL